MICIVQFQFWNNRMGIKYERHFNNVHYCLKPQVCRAGRQQQDLWLTCKISSLCIVMMISLKETIAVFVVGAVIPKEGQKLIFFLNCLNSGQTVNKHDKKKFAFQHTCFISKCRNWAAVDSQSEQHLIFFKMRYMESKHWYAVFLQCIFHLLMLRLLKLWDSSGAAVSIRPWNDSYDWSDSYRKRKMHHKKVILMFRIIINDLEIL